MGEENRSKEGQLTGCLIDNKWGVKGNQLYRHFTET